MYMWAINVVLLIGWHPGLNRLATHSKHYISNVHEIQFICWLKVNESSITTSGWNLPAAVVWRPPPPLCHVTSSIILHVTSVFVWAPPGWFSWVRELNGPLLSAAQSLSQGWQPILLLPYNQSISVQIELWFTLCWESFWSSTEWSWCGNEVLLQ